MGADLLTTYSELADVIENLPLLVRERRRQMHLSARAAAAQLGMAASTITRLEGGQDLDGKHLRTILRWLDGAHGPAPARTPVTAATEAHGEAGEAQEARE